MIIFEKKKRKFEQPVRINGLPFYLIVKMDTSGNISQVFEKPDLKQINWHVSGEHIIVYNFLKTHFDHSSGAITWKEYPIKDGRPFESKYIIGESGLGIAPNWNNPASFAIVAT